MFSFLIFLKFDYTQKFRKGSTKSYILDNFKNSRSECEVRMLKNHCYINADYTKTLENSMGSRLVPSKNVKSFEVISK